MNTFMRHASIASTVALMALGTAGAVNAQTYGDESGSKAQSRASGEQSNFCAENPDQCQPRRMRQVETEEPAATKRQVETEEPAATNEQSGRRNVQQAQTGWRFDADRHERRRHKDARFRFFLGGFWYPEPYWLGYGLRLNPRISCGEGRLILRDRGFRRVRPIECQGRTYTYLGWRRGDTFRVLLSARSGRIVDVDPT